ncbi:transmembrane protein, putative [Bodo saltans]|uniref:Transmembrane protein, putative n=1 Tax=Bodo saltans TaxID=75058 RepID=A0A0S4IZR9_BODSA|nr:transmembrane protein, putative [Bodo saltans]|eukprot:CUG68659.1 transmembrane protein, putative [Bodo saltans]
MSAHTKSTSSSMPFEQASKDDALGAALQPPKASSLRYHLALGASQAMFSASMTIVRAAYRSSAEVSPIVIVWSRLFISTCLFTGIHLFRGQRRRKEIALSTIADFSSDHAHVDEFNGLSRALKIRCIVLGAVCNTVNLLAAAGGLKYSNAVTAGGIQCAVPPVTCVMAYFVYGEMLPMTKVVALILAVLGNMIMTQIWCMFTTTSDHCAPQQASTEGSTYYFGCLCAVASVTVWCTYLVFQRPVVQVLPSSEFLFRSCIYGLCSMSLIALCMWTMIWDEITTPGVMSPNVFVAIGFSGVITSGLAYYLVSLGLSGVSPSAAAIYFCSQSVLVCVFSTIFLGEGMSLLQAGGGLLVVAGMLLNASMNSSFLNECSTRTLPPEVDPRRLP